MKKLPQSAIHEIGKIVLFSAIYLLILMILFSIISRLSATNSNILMALVASIVLLLLLIVGSIIMIKKAAKETNNRVQNIKSTNLKKRFTFVDTIWYSIYTRAYTIKTTYYIIQEEETQKIYVVDAIFPKYGSKSKSNALINNKKDDDKYKITGSFWIEQEIPDFYKRYDKRIVLNGNSFVKIALASDVLLKSCHSDYLYHNNPNCDIISLLENAAFVTAPIEFDNIDDAKNSDEQKIIY